MLFSLAALATQTVFGCATRWFAFTRNRQMCLVVLGARKLLVLLAGSDAWLYVVSVFALRMTTRVLCA